MLLIGGYGLDHTPCQSCPRPAVVSRVLGWQFEDPEGLGSRSRREALKVLA